MLLGEAGIHSFQGGQATQPGNSNQIICMEMTTRAVFLCSKCGYLAGAAKSVHANRLELFLVGDRL